MAMMQWTTAKKSTPTQKTKHTHIIIVMPQKNATSTAAAKARVWARKQTTELEHTKV
jgi:hypothetical protein